MSEKKEVKLLSIKEAAEYLGIKEFRTRKILQSDRVNAVKVKEAHYEKWYVSQEELDKYRATTGRTKDGRKAYIARCNESEAKLLADFCKKNKISFEARYQPKTDEAAS